MPAEEEGENSKLYSAYITSYLSPWLFPGQPLHRRNNSLKQNDEIRVAGSVRVLVVGEV